MSVAFRVNTERCYGCKSCQVACANEHLLTPGVYQRRVRQINSAEHPGMVYVSMGCNHCDAPACVMACPVGAYVKDEVTGLVIQDHSLCIGCKMCIDACPFHAPAYDEADSTTYKCDGCINRRNAGLEPVCVVTCPSANIATGEFEELLAMDAEGVSVRDLVETAPNLVAVLDADLAPEAFADIDGAEGIVDRDGEAY